MNYYFIVCFVSILILLFILSKTIIKYTVFFKYKDIITLFELFLDKSYELTYQNSISTYILDGVRNIPADDKESIERDYVKQTLLLMGPTNVQIVNQFFGKQEFAINYIITYIRKRISSDGLSEIIRKADENK